MRMVEIEGQLAGIPNYPMEDEIVDSTQPFGLRGNEMVSSRILGLGQTNKGKNLAAQKDGSVKRGE